MSIPNNNLLGVPPNTTPSGGHAKSGLLQSGTVLMSKMMFLIQPIGCENFSHDLSTHVASPSGGKR